MKPTEQQLQKVDAYINKELPQDQRLIFEQEMALNPALAEYVSIAISAHKLLSDSDWPVQQNPDRQKEITALFTNKDAQDFAQKASQFLEQKQAGKKSLIGSRRSLLAIAAAAVLVIFVYVQFFTTPTMEQHYTNIVTWEELPTFATKSDGTSQALLAFEQNFAQANYKTVIGDAAKLLQMKDAPQVNVLLYQGAAQLELDLFDEALQTFKNITQTNTLDAHKGYWYIAMVYLKQGDKVKTKEALNKVVEDQSNFNAHLAQKLLKQL
ncbi:MAG: tetratricopeptide repeat protein [Gilvibacter sp.]